MYKCRCTPKKEYTFEEIGKFIFEKSWENSKSVGINIMLVNKMRDIFISEWDEDLDKYKIEIIPNSLSLNFSGDEIRNMYKVSPIF